MKLKEEVSLIHDDVTEILVLLKDENLGIITLVKKHDCILCGNGSKEGLVNKVRNLFYIKLSAFVPVLVLIWYMYGDKIKQVFTGG